VLDEVLIRYYVKNKFISEAPFELLHRATVVVGLAHLFV
jgi:hypothetical protein